MTKRIEHINLTEYNSKFTPNDTNCIHIASCSVTAPSGRKFCVSVADFCKLFSVGKTLTYDLIKDGRLKTVKINRRTLITMESAEALLGGSTKH